MSFSYANPASGPSAGGIGWFDFGALSLSPGQSQTGLTGTLNDGTVVTFDVSVSNISGANRTFTASTVPTWGSAFFGNTNYTGISGNVALKSNLTFVISDNAITISNITVVDPFNNPVPNYTVLVGDAESTGLAESWTFNTDGAPWSLFTTIGNTTSPTLVGLGTQTATITGNNPGPIQNEYILATQSPTNLVLSTATMTTAGGQQAIVVGFATTRILVEKNVAGRIDPADQFDITIGGTPTSTATTTGAASGIQIPKAFVYTIPGTPHTISEAMAPGSVSPLSAYTQVVTASNATPAGSLPPVGTLPIGFTPALGDNVTYTIFNIAPEVFTKTVDKAFVDIGDIITYTVSVENPNNTAITNVLVNDSISLGTSFVAGSLAVVGSAFVGTDPNSGVTLTSIPANTTATLTWQVQVNTLPPVPNPIVNVAMVTVPGGTSGPTNAVTTQVNTAYITVNKTTDKAYANVGDVITYTLTVTNSGNVAANNLVLTDPLPAGTSYVAGSLTGATGTPPTLTLIAPVPASGSSVITYKVLVGASIPNPNPIPNTAAAAFTYTVDPATPNSVSGAVSSNTVTTKVNTAKLVMTKSTDKFIGYIGDIITYQISLVNTGNAPANNTAITDLLATGLSYVPGSLVVSVPAMGDPNTAIFIANPIMPGQIVTISFKAKVDAMPIPNPAPNTAKAGFTYTVEPRKPDALVGSASSNTVYTIVFRNNFGQQITDLISSVALEQAALAAIANAEGAKIQRMAAMQGITPQELICLNKSVADMLDSIAILEAVLKQKLSILDCQIDGNNC